MLRKLQLLSWCSSSSLVTLLQRLPQLWGSCTIARAGQRTGQCWWALPTQSHHFCCFIFALKPLQPQSTEQLGETREAPGWSWECWNWGDTALPALGLGPVFSYWKEYLHSYKLLAGLSNGVYFYNHRLLQE